MEHQNIQIKMVANTLWTAILTITMLGMVFAAPSQLGSVEDQFILCDGHHADIFFLLDSSSSIWPLDYTKQLEFIQQVVDYFPVSPTETRFGVGTYSENFSEEIGFDDNNNAVGFKMALSYIRQKYGETETGKALRRVREHVFRHARQNVKHILVVLTDGKSRYKSETIAEANALKTEGVSIFAVGIGKTASMDELRAIGSTPEETFVHNVTDFNVLNQIRQTLAYEVCKVEAQKQEPYCNAGMETDVMFVYDATSMGTKNVRKIQNFIGSTVQNFGNMDDGTMRTGILSGYCDRNVDLDEYRNKEDFASFVTNSDFNGLSVMVKELYQQSYRSFRGGRDIARRIAVLIVDENVEKMSLAKEMKIARSKQDVQFVVISIGDNSFFDILKPLVMKPINKHFFNLPSNFSLGEIQDSFARNFCEGLKVPGLSTLSINKKYYNFEDIIPVSDLVLGL